MSVKSIFQTLFILPFFTSLSLAAQNLNEDQEAFESVLDIFQVIEADSSLDLFAKSLKKTKVFETLKQDGPFTIFISNNDAFSRVSFKRKFETWTNAKLLKNVVNYHIVEGIWTTEQLKQLSSLPTLQGAKIELTFMDGSLLVGNAPILTGDIRAKNGMIHIVSEVIERPEFDE